MNKTQLSDYMCPTCNFPLKVDSQNEQNRMMCPSCSNKVDPVKAACAHSSCTASFPDIRSANALYAFVDSYFQNSINDDFYACPDVFNVKMVDDATANALLYTAHEPLAWIAEAERILLPMEKKLQYLEALPEKIANEHLSDRIGEQMYFFDIYESSLKGFLPHIQGIRKDFDFALERAQKVSANQEELDSLKARFARLEEKVTTLNQQENLPSDPLNLGAVKHARELRDARLTEALVALGVSAEDTYVSAMALIKKKKNAQALDMLRKLGVYKDSFEQINDLDCYKKFDDIRSIAGKLYLCQKRQEQATKKKVQPTALYDLIPLNEQNPDLIAQDTPMHKIIATYSDKIFHLDKDKQLTCLDLQDQINRFVLLNGKSYIFDSDTKFYNFDGLYKLAVAAKERVVIEKGRNKGKLRKTDTDILIIDLSAEEMTLCDFSIEDIVCVCGSYVFYSKNVNLTGDDDNVQIIGYNVVTGKRITLPQNVYKIYGVIDEYVIFSYQKSSPYNLTLCALSCGVTSFERVLEDNVLDFSCIIGKKIYYTVGAYDMRVLCCVDPTTLERCEVQRGIRSKSGSEIILVRDGWMYFKKGDANNTVLARCRPDGSEYSIICSNFERFAYQMPFIRGFVYYIDTTGALCRVLISGLSHKIIAENIASDMGVLAFFDSRIYFARSEYTGKCALVQPSSSKKKASTIVQTDKYSLSLYSCKLDGSDIRKLCFDFDHIWQLSSSQLLIRRILTDRYIDKNKRTVLENTDVIYEVIDLNEPQKIRDLARFTSSDIKKELSKGVVHVTLKDEVKNKKIPPANSK